ncbi:MAG: hypothetical protein FJX22_04330 [Alphaproteobacteria bacterium]|nr:hypothetical protein [Alphaproteobacteria bacterium]
MNAKATPATKSSDIADFAKTERIFKKICAIRLTYQEPDVPENGTGLAANPFRPHHNRLLPENEQPAGC